MSQAKREIKTELIGVRLAPSLKRALERIAAKQSRTLSNLLHLIAVDYATKTGEYRNGK